MSVQRVKRAFLRATALRGGEREAFLEALRAEDPSAYEHVRELLHHDANDSRALSPSPELVARALGEPLPALADYGLVRELGAGGMGRVFLGKHQPTQALRAIKVLRTRNARLAERLRQEGRLQQSLRHPHVVGVIDVTETAEHEPALVLEYVAGPTLADLLAAGVGLTVGEIDALGRGILGGVAAAHDLGWVHRDLKPSNVLLDVVDDQLVAKVSDFGLAKVVEGESAWATGDTTQRGGLGTKRYMSLEQLTGQPPHRRMDVFALGTVLFELCEGTPAFPTDRHWEQGLARGRMPALTRSDLPAAFRATVGAALAPPEDRPEHAGELLERWTTAAHAESLRFEPQTVRVATLLRDHLPPDPSGDGDLSDAALEHLSVCAKCRAARRAPSVDRLIEPEPHEDGDPVAILVHVGAGADPAGVPTRATAAEALRRAVEHLRAGWQDLEPEHLAPATGVVLHVAAPASGADRTVGLLAELCTPGQLLTSRAFVDALPGSHVLDVISHGHWQSLDDLAPLEVVELVDPAWEAGVRPVPSASAWRVVLQAGGWRPLRAVPSRLPAEPAGFVGRRDVLRDLSIRVRHHRLVTVHGAPGIGKSRAALRFARAWLGAWPGGVWWCEASTAHDASTFCRAVAAAMDVPLGARDPVDTLATALRSRGRCLLVLDNLEQLGPVAASVVERWLANTDEAVVLATSRTPLGLPEESVLRVGPLPSATAVALFHRRAAAVGAVLDPTDHDDAIEALVGELDHVPLAIELCAARARLLTPSDMLSRLAARFRLVASHPGASGRPDRHASLHACLAWSWSQLQPAEQAALAQLSVFAPGFAPEAAEAVLDLPPDAPDPLLVVEGLLDHALLRLSATGRLSLLISVQSFAADHLDDAARLAAEARHGDHYRKYGDPVWLDGVLGPQQTELRQVLAQELDNLVLANERAQSRGAGDVAALTAAAAWRHLRGHGPIAFAAQILEASAGGAGVPGTWALAHAGAARHLLGHNEVAQQHLERARVAAEALDAPVLLGYVHQLLGSILLSRGDLEMAAATFATAHRLYARADASARRAAIEGFLGLVRLRANDLVQARARFEASRDGHRAVANLYGEATALRQLGIVDRLEGRLEDARRRTGGALQIFRGLGSALDEAGALGNLANICKAEGAFDQSIAFNEAALGTARRIGYRVEEAGQLNNLGSRRRHGGELDEAEACYTQALAVLEEVDDPHLRGEVLCNLANLDNLRGRAAEARATYERAIEVLRSVGHQTFEGMALANLGLLCLAQDDLDGAEQYLGEALAVHQQSGRVRFEGFVRYVLGDLDWRRGAVEEAAVRYERAADLARQTGYHELLGAVMGRLALVHATAQRHERAEEHLELADEALAAGASVATELGLLCDRARVHALAGRADRAEQALDEATRRFDRLDLGPDSYVARRLSATVVAVRGG